MAYGLEIIDWSAPWLELWRESGRSVVARVEHGMDCASALNQQAQTSCFDTVRFVPQSDLPTGQAYEDFIYQTRQVPTRNGLHDFFNGLCWLQFPATKHRLNQLQAGQIAQLGVGQVRGVVRDRLTVFDENAILMQTPDVLWHALKSKDWATLFQTLRTEWQGVHLIIFGHSLLEKLTQPRKNITGHVYRVPHTLNKVTEIDTWLATYLSEETLRTTAFAHLPVLGVPGWCTENTNDAFYADESVFRKPQKP